MPTVSTIVTDALSVAVMVPLALDVSAMDIASDSFPLMAWVTATEEDSAMLMAAVTEADIFAPPDTCTLDESATEIAVVSVALNVLPMSRPELSPIETEDVSLVDWVMKIEEVSTIPTAAVSEVP
jgi:hypothetical protein